VRTLIGGWLPIMPDNAVYFGGAEFVEEDERWAFFR